MAENKKISQTDIMKILDACYQKVSEGIEGVNPKFAWISPSVDTLANNYLEKYPVAEEAVKEMMRNQIIKCTTSGFITGFGGFITLPVSIPANISSVLYVQMRMIACTAKMADYDLQSDQVQTLVYACLAGVSLNQMFKKFGIAFGEKVAMGIIKKIPGKVLTKINQKVGFRLLTKMGTTGLVNLVKLVPGVGAVINGGLDFAETKIIADRAYKWFFKGEFEGDTKGDDIEIDISDTEIVENYDITSYDSE